MKRHAVFLAAFGLCLATCKPDKEKAHSTFNPKVTEAHGYVVPLDSMIAPEVILVDDSKLRKIPVGKPKVFPANANVHPAGVPKVVITGVCINISKHGLSAVSVKEHRKKNWSKPGKSKKHIPA